MLRRAGLSLVPVLAWCLAAASAAPAGAAQSHASAAQSAAAPAQPAAANTAPPQAPPPLAPRAAGGQQSRPGASLAGARGQSYKASLATSETLFSLLAALNHCGYDQELSVSNPLRAEVRRDVEQGVAASAAAQAAAAQFCGFYSEHQPGGAPAPQRFDSHHFDPHTLAQYISLALFTSEPPHFQPTVSAAELPPDAAYVLGALPLLENLYTAAGLHRIWQKHAAEYDRLIEQFHDPVAAMILRTDLYLRLQFSGYLGRRYVIYIEPLVAPGAVNARNYGDDYYLVVAPAGNDLPMAALRHTYLHYVLDQYAMNHGTSLDRLRPLLPVVAAAPMDASFKQDISLLVTESLIRAIEARLLPGRGEVVERLRQQQVQSAEREGFVLAQYFYDALVAFEKGPAGLKDSYGEWLYQIDVEAEKKHAQRIEFAEQAAPELLAASKLKPPASLLDGAERRLMSRDPRGAAQLAQQALDARQPDAARALFILARAAAESGDMPGAMNYFQRTLGVARQPRLLAWSHIYLGRIFDLQQDRTAAVAEYKAALGAGDAEADTRSAAERGLAQAYQPPAGAARPQ